MLVRISIQPIGHAAKTQDHGIPLLGLSDADREFGVMFPELESLSISNSAIGNRGMDWIEQLPKLKRLRLGTTKITKSGIEELKKKNPGCQILWD